MASKNIILYFLSSSEWNFEKERFVPNYYIDVSKQVEKKIKAFKCYKQEIQNSHTQDQLLVWKL